MGFSVLPIWPIFHFCPEMQAVTKIADFYVNYVNRDGSNVLANLTILAIFKQITSPEMSLPCWRIRRFICKLHHQRWAQRVGEFDDFGDF